MLWPEFLTELFRLAKHTLSAGNADAPDEGNLLFYAGIHFLRHHLAGTRRTVMWADMDAGVTLHTFFRPALCLWEQMEK